MSRVWILGAPDPEMEAIDALLRECGERVTYAANARGDRVHPGSAYQAETVITDCGNHACTDGVTDVVLIECELLTPGSLPPGQEDICHPELAGRGVTRIDHHRAGDPGYGRPPSEFLAASSIGQVILALARAGALVGRLRALTKTPGAYPGGPFILRNWEGFGDQWLVSDGSTWRVVPHDLVLTAAADHCLGAAYRGECPGVDPEALMQCRAAERARFQGRDVSDVCRDITETTAALHAAPECVLDSTTCDWHAVAHRAADDCLNSRGSEYSDHPCETISVRDMRREPPYPELVEAATRAGLAYISGPLISPDGRRKFTCSGRPEHVRAFFDWAARAGLVDAYGDPARGFAGAYEARAHSEESCLGS